MKLGGRDVGGIWEELEGEANMVNIYYIEFIKLKMIPKGCISLYPL